MPSNEEITCPECGKPANSEVHTRPGGGLHWREWCDACGYEMSDSA